MGLKLYSKKLLKKNNSKNMYNKSIRQWMNEWMLYFRQQKF